MPEKLTFIALNEFNRDLLEKISAAIPDNKCLTRIVQMDSIQTCTDDIYESNFLEPWVQWVGIHTGLPSSVHAVKNLGDVPKLTHPQIWERLSLVGKSSVVWGAMNAKRGHADQCWVFAPDPWVFNEPVHPEEYNDVFKLPRYVAKNYTSLSKLKVAILFAEFLVHSMRLVGVKTTLHALRMLMDGLRRFGPKNFVFISIFEFLSAAIFSDVAGNKGAQLNFIFLNSIAHVQHHYWRSSNIEDLPEIKFTYTVVDELLARLDRKLDLFSEGQEIIICNALNQMCCSEEEDWYLYRVRDMAKFLSKLSVPYSRFETLMTHDGHIFCDTDEELGQCCAAMRDIRINGQPMHYVEVDEDAKKLFFRICITHELESDAIISRGNLTLPFTQYVERIVRRTGRHVSSGTIFHNLDSLNSTMGDRIQNHEVFRIIYPELYPNPSATVQPAAKFVL